MRNGLTITESLGAGSCRLDKAAAVARGAFVCTEAGADREAIRMALELDIHVLPSKAHTPLWAVTLLERMRW
ncbi:MAG: hypothetical protein K0S56_1236 [Microvirga sp.]|jgi:hypothetical protein|nr:hypothetical protein [Microvirga sp.]